MTLRPGDRVILYTDGLTEAVNKAGEEFGEERLRSLLSSSNLESVETQLDRIYDEVAAFSDHQPIKDDQTLIVMEVA